MKPLFPVLFLLISTSLSAQLSTNTFPFDALCFGSADGSAHTVASGGTPNYSYLWSNGQTIDQATGLSAGTYYVTITDAIGSMVVDSAIIGEPSLLVASIVQSTPPTCFGGNDGSIEMTASGGTPGSPTYVYQMGIGPSASGLRTNFTAGTYSLTVTDGNFCSATIVDTLVDPDSILINVTTSDYNGAAITCLGASDAFLTTNAMGGAGGFSYAWSPSGSTSANLISLSAGTYCVSVTDALGCIQDTCVIINDPVQLAGTASTVDVRCNNAHDGQATINATPGTGTTGGVGYSYKIVGPNHPWSPTFSPTTFWDSLSPGAYYIAIRDANNCEVQIPIQITEPDSVLMSLTTVDAFCYGSATGSATAQGSGGVGNFTYAWGPPIAGQTSQTVSALAQGTYTITVSDGNACENTASFIVGEEPAIISTIINTSDVTCIGDSTATASISISGGVPSYTYIWSSSNQTSSTVNNLAIGTHVVTITDMNGCTTTDTITIYASPQALSASLNTNSASCGLSDGQITTNPQGGTAPYFYNWSSGSTTSTASGLAAGIYSVTINDNAGCAIVLSDTVGGLFVQTSVQAISCSNLSDGSISLTPITGTNGASFSYQWSLNAGNQTTNTATGLAIGSYTATITDLASGCSSLIIETITAPSSIVLTVDTLISAGCNGASMGAVMISASGGTPNYTYNIGQGGQSSGIFTSLSSGNYSITVLDSNGCSASVSVTIPNPPVINIQLTSKNMSCHGLNDGQIIASVTGGTPYSSGFGYDVTWSTFNFGPPDTLNNLAQGIYTLTVQDSNGCVASLSTAIQEPSPMWIQLDSVSGVSCPDSNGYLMLSASGGPSILDGINDAYAFSLDGGTNFVSGSNPYEYPNMVGGYYSIVARDTNYPHCIAEFTLVLGVFLDGTLSTTDETCSGAMDGSATISPFSYGPATINWSSGGVVFSSSDTATGLAPNVVPNNFGGFDTLFVYNVTLNDTNNCVHSEPFYIQAADSLLVVTVNNGDETATVNASGGVPPYTYLWDANAYNQTTSIAYILSDGVTYSVTVTDSLGCQSVGIVTISVGLSEIEGLESFNLYPNPNYGTFVLDVELEKESFVNLEIRNVLGKIIYDKAFNASSIQENIQLEDAPAGTYFLSLTMGNQQLTRKITLFK